MQLLFVTRPWKSFLSFVFLFLSGLLQAQTLVLPGDHPDPSVIKVGDTYWASATTSNWFPAFPLLHSKDLVHWTQQGYVFNKMPDWADYYFWAPELSYENGKIYVYYAAHKKNGNLCIGVASADKPEGPYTDHGPLVCQVDGSIDAFPMRDESGRLFLVWKEDANSIGKPTPIWIQQMNEERTALVGEKKELFRNDAPWEGNLVEGVSMMRHGGYFYAFYAASACCGAACTYGVGVARSKSLLGPWEKCPQNPIITNSPQWTCPGHGTPIEKDGRYYFLYHAYDKTSNVFTGRQGLLQEFNFTPDNWISFIHDQAEETKQAGIVDPFNTKFLSGEWQWSVFQQPVTSFDGDRLYLQAEPNGIFIGQKIAKGNYYALTKVNTKKSTAEAGLGAIGDEKNQVSLFISGNHVKIEVMRDGKKEIVLDKSIKVKKNCYLRMMIRNNKDIIFSYSKNGKLFNILNKPQIDGGFLPPWDRAVRAGLIARGNSGSNAVFESFSLDYP
jgi:xylan 1,4-beta-xylosidase